MLLGCHQKCNPLSVCDGPRVSHSLVEQPADKQPEWNKSSIFFSFTFVAQSVLPRLGEVVAPPEHHQPTNMYLINSVDSFYAAAAAASTFIPQNAKDAQFISGQGNILRVDARTTISCFYLLHAPQHTRHIPFRTRPSGEERRQYPSQ